MSWLKKKKASLMAQEKKDLPQGLWTKCDGCGEILFNKELEGNLWVCPKCSHHFRIRSLEYVGLLADPDSFEELFTAIQAKDPLGFRDARMRYPDRLSLAQQDTQLNDA